MKELDKNPSAVVLLNFFCGGDQLGNRQQQCRSDKGDFHNQMDLKDRAWYIVLDPLPFLIHGGKVLMQVCRLLEIHHQPNQDAYIPVPVE